MNLNEINVNENCEEKLRPLYLLKLEANQKYNKLQKKIQEDIIGNLLLEISNNYHDSYRTILQYLFSQNYSNDSYNKEEIYNNLNNFYKDEEINKLASTSLLAKQSLRKFLNLNEMERKNINDSFIEKTKNKEWNYKDRCEAEINKIYNLSKDLYDTINEGKYIYIENISTSTNIKIMYIYENGLCLSINIINGIYSSNTKITSAETISFTKKYILEHKNYENANICCYINESTIDLKIDGITYEMILKILDSTNLNPEYFIELADKCSKLLSYDNTTIQMDNYKYNKYKNEKLTKEMLFECYKIAISLGDKKANYLMGKYFHYIDENIEKAEEYYKIALNYGITDAYIELGRISTTKICKTDLDNIYKYEQEALTFFNKAKDTKKYNITKEIEITKKKVQEMEKEKLLRKIYNEIKRITSKKCYEIKVENNKPDILDSKIFGKPYLPIGAEYPKNSKGEYLALLLQINFETIRLENYPQNGILQVFVDKNFFHYPVDYVIKYYENIEDTYQTNLPIIDASAFLVHEPMKISFLEGTTHMPLSDYRFENIAKEVYQKMEESKSIKFKKYELIDMLSDIVSYPYEGLIGGYADFSQFDIRKEKKNQNYTESIIKMDISLDKRFQGDGEIINVLISTEDLKNKKFENAILYYDC